MSQQSTRPINSYQLSTINRQRLNTRRSVQGSRFTIHVSRLLALLLLTTLLLSACDDGNPQAQSGPTPTVSALNTPSTSLADFPPVMPTATVPGGGVSTSRSGHYENHDLGISVTYPESWKATNPQDGSAILEMLYAPSNEVIAALFHSPATSDASLEDTANGVFSDLSNELSGAKLINSKAFSLEDGRDAWLQEFSANSSGGVALHGFMVITRRDSALVGMWAMMDPSNVTHAQGTTLAIFKSISLTAPQLYGISRDQALFLAGGESNNPREYDPATSGGNDLVFSGLVMLNPKLEVVPDLAESWEISADGKVYTFHLRQNARFHNGRPVTAQDVVYSWERAADPATNSDLVLTYLSDIVGVADRHSGKAKTISGLKVINDNTLQVTIDASKPYFLMKLTYGVSSVLDRANVESGSTWYRTPNGTGPYKLIRWESGKAILYERNSDFYLTPPAIPYVVVQLYAGAGMRLYETGDIDLTGVPQFDVQRVLDPKEPLHADLLQGVSMCTSKVTFDVTKAPFDDPKVRQAFALAVDRQRYVDVVQYGVGIPARGLFPPALPGYNSKLIGLDFNPQLAKQRLAESRYGSADKLPPIVFTSSGFGSNVDPDIAALADMWQKNLGVTIQVENLEPDKAQDEIYAGRHGQLISDGWCADYPDPENFADALFHTGAQQNVGHYSNPFLDTMLEKARTERNVTARMQMYAQAEQAIVNDAAAIFLSHSLSYSLVKPYIKGYVQTPINVPIFRYLSLDPTKRK